MKRKKALKLSFDYMDTPSARTVASIAAEFGFASPQHFANHFKLATGLTPREWRERV